jgi:DNA polymerase elongation subunit (family B)
VFERPPRIPVTLDDLQKAVCLDLETIVNCFTCHVQPLFGEWEATFEISEWRDDRALLSQWIEYWRANRVPIVTFNGLNFDYPLLHFFWQNPGQLTPISMTARRSRFTTGQFSRRCAHRSTLRRRLT